MLSPVTASDIPELSFRRSARRLLYFAVQRNLRPLVQARYGLLFAAYCFPVYRSTSVSSAVLLYLLLSCLFPSIHPPSVSLCHQ